MRTDDLACFLFLVRRYDFSWESRPKAKVDKLLKMDMGGKILIYGLKVPFYSRTLTSPLYGTFLGIIDDDFRLESSETWNMASLPFFPFSCVETVYFTPSFKKYEPSGIGKYQSQQTSTPRAYRPRASVAAEADVGVGRGGHQLSQTGLNLNQKTATWAATSSDILV